MKRIVSKTVGQSFEMRGKWCIYVESVFYGKTYAHILSFDSKEAVDRVCEGYEYSTDDIFREPRPVSFKALSVQQPFALLEVMGIKGVENRSWKTDYRGRIYIHACSYKSVRNIKYALTDEQRDIVSGYPIINSLLEDKELMYSAIIGHVDLVDIVEDSSSVWALADHYHWILENPVLFDSPIIHVKGQLNLWDCRECMINGKF